MAVKTTTNVVNIAALSEQDKDVIFVFDTARERLKAGMIRALLIPSMVIVGALLLLYTTPSIEGLDWVRTTSEWVAYIGIAVGLLGAPLFSGHLRGD